MIHSIQGSQAAQLYATQNPPAPPQKQAPSSQPQDSVHLSAAALSSGDADHDGDSH